MDKELLGSLIELVEAQIPGFRLKEKRRSWFMWILFVAGLWIFCKGFMATFVTTFWKRTWAPYLTKWLTDGAYEAFQTLAHEYVHMRREQMEGWTYSVSYLSPQVLVLGPLAMAVVLLAIKSTIAGIVFSGLAVACLAPWPASRRATEEELAYAMTMAVEYWRTGQISQVLVGWIVDQFGKPYYWMDWNKKVRTTKMLEWKRKIEAGWVLDRGDMPWFREIYELLKSKGALHRV